MSRTIQRVHHVIIRRGRADRDKGASMVEYAILVGVMAAVILAAALFVGGQISTLADGIVIGT